MQMEWYTLLLLCLAAFCAGLVDAIVGGGGLIQLPVALILLPAQPVSALIASLKIPAFSGTSVAAIQYIRKVSMDWKRLSLMCTLAFFASFSGSYLLTLLSNAFMKPVIFGVLCIVAIYTFIKKNFGQNTENQHDINKPLVFAIAISLIIGFYDGFIGPGAGSFLMLAFISLLGYDFLHASAHAKMVNLATNLGSITLFLFKSKIIWMIALPMALSNAIGGAIGVKLAINKGNKFIRIFFLFIVLATLLRFGYDIFVKH
jgi:hypothetical protein